MLEKKNDLNSDEKIEAILKKQSLFLTKVKWPAMFPFLIELKDSILLEASSEPFKKHDVVLYKNINEDILLKRIFKIKDDYLLVAGDSEITYEKIYRNQVIAKMKSYYKDGREILINNIEYLKYLKSLKNRRKIQKNKDKMITIFK